MKTRFSPVAALLVVIGSFVVSATPASAQNIVSSFTNRLEVPVSGVVQNVGNIGGTFAISRFALRNGALVAHGQFNGTVTDGAGNVIRTIVTNVAWPVSHGTGGGGADAESCDGAAQPGVCDILNLVLGPLHLDLLGLVIDLNQVVLDITAQAGAGNLLGNLLCAITNLLNAGSFGQQLINLLNQLLFILAGL